MTTLLSQFDGLLLDLDGTLFKGRTPISTAQQVLADPSIPRAYITNNASRLPEDVVEHLAEMGFAASIESVATSAQAGIELLGELVSPGALVLVVGGPAVETLLHRAGYATTRSADDGPVAVLQGLDPAATRDSLSEAVLAIRAGATWVATNLDATLPTERGLVIGNGSLVAAVAHATDRQPVSAGKPAPRLFTSAAARLNYARPLAVGDRLDTDIRGANNAGISSLYVATGVSSLAEVVIAPPADRPTYIAADLRALHVAPEVTVVAPQPHWQVVQAAADRLELAATPAASSPAEPDPFGAARAVLAFRAGLGTADHGTADHGGEVQVLARDDAAARAIAQW